MPRIDKTVFISYRRTNFSWALAIFQDLTYNGYDVFFDFLSIAAGDFESVILENIKARAHFIIVLTPSALEHCGEPGDWLRREIETALDIRRNIVPLMLENFDFGAPEIANQLTGDLEALKSYNGLRVPPEYFQEAMGRLRDKYLNVPLDAVLHPASLSAKRAAKDQQAAATSAPAVQEEELTAGEWFERGFKAVDADEKLRCYSEAIRLKPDYGEAFCGRGFARQAKGDLDGALQDYNEAIRLKPDYVKAFNNRGTGRQARGDLEGAMQDFNEAVRLNPKYFLALYNRAIARKTKDDLDGALQDYNETVRLKPDDAEALNNRGNAREAKGDSEGALEDYTEAIRLRPDYANAFYNRGSARRNKGDLEGAVGDFQKYLDLGGGARYGDQSKVEHTIRDLKKALANPPRRVGRRRTKPRR